MSYDLDGIFSTRQQGQVVKNAQIVTTTQRQGVGADEAIAPVAPGILDGTVTLPIVGEVSKKTLLLAGVGIAVGAYFLTKK
jgi:hypothetical protein